MICVVSSSYKCKMNDKMIELSKNKDAFSEMKKYMLDYMGSKYTLPPEEGLFDSMLGNCDENTLEFLEKEYDRALDEFRHKFWCEKIVPEMNRDAFIKFLNTMGDDLGGEKFFKELEEYIQKHYKSE